MSEFLKEPEQQINEIFSASSVMDVSELRTLYYGRLNLFVTFTDDGQLSMRPDSNEDRPAGYVAYSVPDVIGRKVKSPEFYANVYRVKKNNKSRMYIENIKTYTKKEYDDDIDKLYQIDYIDESDIFDALQHISAKSTLRSHFHKLWEVTRYIAKASGGVWKQVWREIFLDMGYNGITDQSGIGLLINKKVPVTLHFDMDIEEFDIVPIQKFKKDPRKRVRRQVNRQVKRLSTARNRVAKKRFTQRTVDKKNNKMAYQALGKILEYL